MYTRSSPFISFLMHREQSVHIREQCIKESYPVHLVPKQMNASVTNPCLVVPRESRERRRSFLQSVHGRSSTAARQCPRYRWRGRMEVEDEHHRTTAAQRAKLCAEPWWARRRRGAGERRRHRNPNPRVGMRMVARGSEASIAWARGKSSVGGVFCPKPRQRRWPELAGNGRGDTDVGGARARAREGEKEWLGQLTGPEPLL